MKNVKSRIKALFILVFAAIALTLGSCSLDHGPVDSSKLDTYKVVFIFNDAAGTVVSTKEIEVVKGGTLLVSQIPQIRDQLKADGYEIPSSYEVYWVLLNDEKEPIDLDPEAEVNNLLNITEAICDNEGKVYVQVAYKQFGGTVSFISNGGTAVEPIVEVEVGQTLQGKQPADPTRVGYTFLGWYDKTLTSLFDWNTVLTEEAIELYAKWEANDDTAYAVEHYFEALDGTYKLESSEKLAGTTEELVEAEALVKEGFTHNEKHPEALEEAQIAADGSLVLKVYYSRNSYTVTFDAAGGEEKEAQTYKYGQALNLGVAAKTGYTFLGWTLEGEAFAELSMPAKDLELVATWTSSTNTAYAVEHYFEALDGSYAKDAKVDALFGETGSEVEAVVRTVTGFEHNAEHKDALESATILADGSLVLRVYYSRSEYVVSFDAVGGVAKAEQTYKYGEALDLGETTKVGYTFAKWLYNGNALVISAMPAYDMELTAVWTPNKDTAYKVEHYFEALDGSYVKDSKVDDLQGITDGKVTAAARTVEGFTHNPEHAEAYETAYVLPDGSLVLRVYYSRNVYALTINVDGAKQEVKYAYEEAVATPTAPEKVGYTFAGWTPAVPATMPAEDVEVVAEWTINQYTLTINVDGVKQEVEYDYLEAVATPAAPEKVGHTFAGWAPVVPATMPAEDVEVVAQWTINQYSISFDLAGGVSVTIEQFAAEIVALFNASDEAGSKVVTKETFHSNSHPNIKGIYNKAENLEAHKWLFEFVKAEITALGADSAYVVETVEMLDKMIAGDTTAIGSGSYANGRTLFRHFVHNLINKNHEAVNSAYTKYVPDFTLEENQEKVLVLLNDFLGTLYYGEEIVAPANLVKAGYVFTGWTPSVPATMPAEDVVYTAQWELEKYSISFEIDGGEVDSELMESGFFGDPSKSITFSKYDNSGLAAEIYFCDTGVTPNNSLRWQYKILLKYNASLNAYEVVAVDAAKASANNAASAAGVTWTHAIASASTDVSTYATVGQYLVLEKSVVLGDTNFTGAIYESSQYVSKMKDVTYTILDAVELISPTKNGYRFEGWYDESDNLVDVIASGTTGNIKLTAKWEKLYTISFDLAGGTVDAQYMTKYMEGDPSSVLSLGSYSNTGLADGIYFCDTSVTAHNSLRWQYKILLKYNGKLNAYEIVAVDAAKASANNAASAAGVTWTHAIASSSSNITTTVSVGDYIVLSKNVVSGDTNFTGSAYSISQFKEKVKDIEFTKKDVVELITPEKDGFQFIGWYDQEDNYIESIPAGTEKDFVLTAKWGTVSTITLNPNDGLLPDEWYYVVINGDSKKDIQIGKYDNTGLADGIYFCDTGVTVHNSLRWQYKILLKYDPDLEAYEVVAVDAAKASANNAASTAGVTWTHAIASASTDVSTYATVGQYIVLNKKVALSDTNFIASSYDASQFETKIEKIRHISSETKELPIPTRTGYKFLGWYDELNNLISILDDSIDTDLTLTAKWVETNEIQLSESDEIALSQLGVKPDLFVKSDLIRDLCEMNGKEYQLNTTCFTTLAAALEAAQENDVIYVFAGTYSEALTISTANIKLVGPNYNIQGNGSRVSEANITGSVTISASSVTVDGLKFAGTGALVVTASKTIISNCYISSSSSHGLEINAEVNGFTFTHSTLYSTNSGVKGIYSTYVVSDANISNNVFINTSGTSSTYPDAIRLQSVSGTIDIENNSFDFPGGNYTVFLGSSSVAENTTINFKYNTITTTHGYNASGVSFRALKASCTLNIIGNTFNKVSGTVIEARGSSSSDVTTAATVNIKNNAIMDTSTNVRFNVATTNVTIDSNYAYKDFAFNGNGVTVTVTNAKADANSALAGAQ